MTLQKALQLSPICAAKRPYYSMPVDGQEPSKTIISRGNLEDVYVVWTDNGNFVHQLDDRERYKVQGREDWEPVGKKSE